MNRRLPPLNALRVFEAAARLESFSAAAEQLNVTHGAVSRQIAQLEDWLGVALFLRHGRRVQLSDAGRQYLPTLQNAFDSIATATEKLTSNRPRLLRINVTPTLAMHWLLPRLTRFQRRHPGVELRLATSDAAINNQHADFDIAIRRGNDHWHGFVSHTFLTEHELPAISPALLARLPLRDVADLAQHTLLHSETRPVAWERWLAAAGQPALQAAGHQHFDHYYLALQAAIDGLGITLGPLPVIEELLASGKLVTPLDGPRVRVRGYSWVLPLALAEDALCADFCAWLEEEGES
ncbi:transcriptional regulator GcvA [Vogesella sp. LIG4]|uniref:transcriptional regulator GcvA n=1 Tax=Vogesella sp. LIG4 TaxID=1192162 RepID=UPI00082009EE|nr:transcriptional regulator GcvA [Vogesella sp. LIG4]SCK06478.1 LysR family transcriptional regulator, glycine cleavage system transcriptional activator [Vogesella sp. LIG4]